MEKEYGFSLPAAMRLEFGAVVQTISDGTGKEVLPGMIWDAFENEYLRPDKPLCP